MKSEIEVKFLHVDHGLIRQKLREVCAILEHPMRLMKRITFQNDTMRQKNGWIRVRDEGDKITIAYKQVDSFDIDGTKEIETNVENFEAAAEIFANMGLEKGSFQESRRESWRFGDAQIELDEWPWLDSFIEIEAPSAHLVSEAADKLGLDISDALSGDVMVAYREQYPHLGLNDTIGSLEQVRFDMPLPDVLTSINDQ